MLPLINIELITEIWKYDYWKMWAVDVNTYPVGRQISVEEGTGA